MQGLMSEIRLNPGVGYVKADKARSSDDLDRERELLRRNSELKEQVKRLERRARDARVAVSDDEWDGVLPNLDDRRKVTVVYKNKENKMAVKTVGLTWGEILSVIGPSMFGYLQRRGKRGYNQPDGYTFEESLVEHIRLTDLEEFGKRQINLVPQEIDSILLLLKQMGILVYETLRDGEKDEFRGLTLTEYGELELTKLNLSDAV